MFKGKAKVTTIIFLITAFFLLGAIVYISSLLTSGSGETSNIAPQTTKAANITYSKLVALNTSPTEPTATEIVTPSEIISPTEEGTPTPTEIILAYNNPMVTGTATNAAQISTTLSPTKVKNLPNSGFVYNGLVIFGAATLLVFFAFIF